MRIIFSRKGFDSGSGGAPSPIINGRPISLPIPTQRRSVTTYAALGLGEAVQHTTRGRIGGEHLCHDDPMFRGGQCYFGQCGAAQAHLANQGVGVGDTFLFFGLFADGRIGGRHHRIYGYMDVQSVVPLSSGGIEAVPGDHPHLIGEWNANNTLYIGEGATARNASDALRLTHPGAPLRHWRIPPWLRSCGLSFHRRPERWLADDTLETVARGQEFVADTGDDPAALAWLHEIKKAIRA